jgi:hypothetical protein
VINLKERGTPAWFTDVLMIALADTVRTAARGTSASRLVNGICASFVTPSIGVSDPRWNRSMLWDDKHLHSVCGMHFVVVIRTAVGLAKHRRCIDDGHERLAVLSRRGLHELDDRPHGRTVVPRRRRVGLARTCAKTSRSSLARQLAMKFRITPWSRVNVSTLVAESSDFPVVPAERHVRCLGCRLTRSSSDPAPELR